MRHGLAERLTFFGILAAAGTVLLAWWVLHGALHEAMRGGFEQRLEERAELVAARFSARPGSSSGTLPTYTEPRAGDDFGRIFSGWYWRVQGAPSTLHSRSLWDAELSEVTQVASGRLEALGPRREPLFGIVRPLVLEGDDGLQLEVFGPSTPVLEELRAFDRHLLTLLLLLLLALAAVSLIQVRFGLRPLRRLRTALKAVMDGTRTRLGRGYGPDLDPFAGELDGLLERNARIVARARGHAADLAHALKKPLALLRGEADAARQVPSDLIRAQVQSVVQLIDRHLARAGSGAGESRRVALRPRLESLVALMRRLHANRLLQWQLDLPESLHWRGEPTDLEEMLGNLMDNAGKWARTQVRISAIDRQGQLLICIDDDGPGLDEAQLAQAAQRGTRFDQQVEGTGLGLAICADIAGTYQGTLELTRGPLGGLRAELMLPD